jgi:hypothetical protein
MLREGVISFGKPRIAEAELCERSIRGMGGNGMTAVGAKQSFAPKRGPYDLAARVCDTAQRTHHGLAAGGRGTVVPM